MSRAEELVLQDRAEQVVALARQLGADEATVRVARNASTEISRRDRRIEKLQQSRSLSLSISLLVDHRYSSHSTSDLRPEALQAFLARAVDATRQLEPDPHRGLPDRALMGLNDTDLEREDPSWNSIDPAVRSAAVAELEERVLAKEARAPIRSAAAYIWDDASSSTMVCSNGFVVSSSRTSFGHGVTVSLEDEGGRLPEGYSFYGAHHAADLPGQDFVTAEAIARVERRLGSKAAPSGRYPLLLENRNAGRILGVLLGPMHGSSVYEGRSCVADKVGKQIASAAFTLTDDPSIPRGSGSRPCDGDGLPARQRVLVADGVLQQLLIGVYNGRRMGVPSTGGSTSNLIIPPGTRSVEQIARALPRVIRVEGFLGGNTSATTGDFSFGIHGTLLENGEPAQAVSEMNVSGNLFDLLARYTEAADDPWTFGAYRVPTLLFDDVQFSGV